MAERQASLLFLGCGTGGSIVRVCDELLLTQPAISGQIRLLENALGEKLFARTGRNEL